MFLDCLLGNFNFLDVGFSCFYFWIWGFGDFRTLRVGDFWRLPVSSERKIKDACTEIENESSCTITHQETTTRQSWAAARGKCG